MAKNSVLSRPQVSASVGRSAADLTETFNFSQSAGMICPIYCHAFIAGTDGYIDRTSFTRTATPVFPAFQDVKQCVDVFLVPLRYIYGAWNDWKLNINDLNSSLFQVNTTQQNYAPNINMVNFMVNYFSKGVSANNFARLAEPLGYGNLPWTSFNYPYLVNLLPLAAYQKIYFDHYRNTSYENNNPYAYNLDWLYNVSNCTLNHTGKLDIGTTYTSPAGAALQGLTQLRFVNYRNDYFHNIYPSINYSLTSPTGREWDVPSSVYLGPSSISGNGFSVESANDRDRWTGKGVRINDLYKGDVSGFSSLSGTTDAGSVANAFHTHIVSGSQSQKTTVDSYNVYAIRAAFALDKLLRASAYAPKHVKDQFKARFGVDVPASVSQESIRVASWQNDIVFGEVTSTADTTDSDGNGDSLGAIGGKGIGSARDGRVHFHCAEDSILIAVQYFTPKPMYDAVLSEWNAKLEREDFFQPEFQNLGLRPLYCDFVTVNGMAAGSSNRPIVGWTVPNQYYKLGINKNYGIFKNTYIHASSGSNDINVLIDSSPLSAFTTHVNNVSLRDDTESVGYTYFKVSPADLNPIFINQYDVEIGNPLYDQFYGQCTLGIKITHNMSVHGQPSL